MSGGDDDDGPAPVADEPVNDIRADEQRVSEHGEHAVVGGAIEARTRGGQLRLQLGSDEQLFVKLRLAAGAESDIIGPVALNRYC